MSAPRLWQPLARFIGLLIIFHPAQDAGAGDGKSLIAYRNSSLTFSHQNLAASELYPFRVQAIRKFQYEYRLFHDVGEELPLVLAYRDDEPEGLFSMGWRLLLNVDLAGGVTLSIDRPILITTTGEKEWSLSFGHEDIPVERIMEDGNVYLVAWSTDRRIAYRFAQWPGTSPPVALLREIRTQDGQTAVNLQYEASSGKPLLRSVELKSARLSFRYRSDEPVTAPKVTERPRLMQMVLAENSGVNAKPLARWELTYQPIKSRELLMAIRFNSASGQMRDLRFDYAGLKPGRLDIAPATEQDGAGASSMWKLVEGEPRWRLPNRMSVGTHPGLRFMDLNHDGSIDIVETQHRKFNSWLWNPRTSTWDEFGTTYLPPQASVSSTNPVQTTGGHYNGLVKKYANDKFNTSAFQSFVVSDYRPTADGKSLQYETAFYFPRVFNGKLTPGPTGEIWQRDDHSLLRLPVPLQYEGERPWPPALPGIATVERKDNQGAQFVDFTHDGHWNLLYVGIRYRDATTGKVLLADSAIHRDTGNWTPMYETQWENQGVVRKVKVDMCQAFWRSREPHWSERYPNKHPGKPFWVRRDLGPTGQTNGRYVLPWHKDPAYHYHYQRFRGVSFARLDFSSDFSVFAIVRGRGLVSPIPGESRPEARDIYALSSDTQIWQRLPPESGFYPPDEFFLSQSSTFLDVTGDGLDDAVIGTGSNRRTWVNTGSNPRWRDAPEYYLPRECDLGTGDTRVLDLNGDNVQDLIVGTGHHVYLNRSLETPGDGPSLMTTFTDERGKQRSVADILSDTDSDLNE